MSSNVARARVSCPAKAAPVRYISLCALLFLAWVGCRRETGSEGTPHGSASPTGEAARADGPASEGPGRFIPATLASPTDWCREHGVPESLCARCNPALIAGFKERGDWCGGHDMPESQCLQCNPELAAKWSALKPKHIAAEEAAQGKGKDGVGQIRANEPTNDNSPTDAKTPGGTP